ncbi:hypothetical protein DPMN_103037 [Dreissena polymorpha]|uniref:Uncharacterized protein n=1 Tax=Dreissena polymorpha TaxID=45954 RepID=A0A9D4H759_DREPO|nr:hypothetical protein DPMN_103037 [Dreissena polymorpha]
MPIVLVDNIIMCQMSWLTNLRGANCPGMQRKTQGADCQDAVGLDTEKTIFQAELRS